MHCRHTFAREPHKAGVLVLALDLRSCARLGHTFRYADVEKGFSDVSRPPIIRVLAELKGEGQDSPSGPGACHQLGEAIKTRYLAVFSRTTNKAERAVLTVSPRLWRELPRLNPLNDLPILLQTLATQARVNLHNLLHVVLCETDNGVGWPLRLLLGEESVQNGLLVAYWLIVLGGTPCQLIAAKDTLAFLRSELRIDAKLDAALLSVVGCSDAHLTFLTTLSTF